MKIVELLFDIPVNRTFDYLPGEFASQLFRGARVSVPFGAQKRVGIVLSFGEREVDEKREGYKEIFAVYDEFTLITEELFLMAEFMAQRYFASLGQALFSIIGGLPLRYQSINNSSSSPPINLSAQGFTKEHLLFGSVRNQREYYRKMISQTLEGSLISLFPETLTAGYYYEEAKAIHGERVVFFHAGLKNKEKSRLWLKMLTEKNLIVIGTRIAVFAPCCDLKSIIIYGSKDSSYKEKQTPRYDAVEVAEYRSNRRQISMVTMGNALTVEEYFEVDEK